VPAGPAWSPARGLPERTTGPQAIRRLYPNIPAWGGDVEAPEAAPAVAPAHVPGAGAPPPAAIPSGAAIGESTIPVGHSHAQASPGPAPVPAGPKTVEIEAPLTARAIVSYLWVRSGGDEGYTIEIPQRLTIGRGPDNDVQLHDASVSTTHAEVVAGPEGVYVRDLGSRNGTYLEGQRVDSRWLQPNDVMTVGQTIIQYCQAAR